MADDWQDADEYDATPERTRISDGEGASDTQALDFTVPVTNIGRYEIRSQLGRGGFGFVYLARDPVLNRNVAIKVPRWDKPLDAESAERFLHEGRVLAQLNDPAIVSVYDVGVTEDGVPYVVMEFVEGRSLAKVLRAGPMSTEASIRLLLLVGASGNAPARIGSPRFQAVQRDR
jgi:serine/threonine protein kinase